MFSSLRRSPLFLLHIRKKYSNVQFLPKSRNKITVTNTNNKNWEKNETQPYIWTIGNRPWTPELRLPWRLCILIHPADPFSSSKLQEQDQLKTSFRTSSIAIVTRNHFVWNELNNRQIIVCWKTIPIERRKNQIESKFYDVQVFVGLHFPADDDDGFFQDFAIVSTIFKLMRCISTPLIETKKKKQNCFLQH